MCNHQITCLKCKNEQEIKGIIKLVWKMLNLYVEMVYNL